MPTILSYLKATYDLSPFGLITGAPLLNGLSTSMSTLTRRNLFCSEEMALASMFKTSPNPLPISNPASLFIKSKGRPYTCTHSCMLGKVTLASVITFSHRRSNNSWISKHHEPLSRTHFSWLSSKNLNWSSTPPTSMIFRSFPNLYTVRSRFFAALRLGNLSDRKRPIRLSEHSPRACLRWWTRTSRAPSSSTVKEIFWILLINSESMVPTLEQVRKTHPRWERELL